MAKSLYEYRSLEDTLLKLKNQVIDSINYAEGFIPDTINNAEDLFYFLHGKVHYMDDPKTRELLMTMRTMMEGTRTDVPGGGDCDDFTITSLASLYAIGYDNLYVVLVGYEKDLPVHIYAAVNDNGRKWFDLTNEDFNFQREHGPKGKYKFQQIFKFTI